jgi:hypothetical protein
MAVTNAQPNELRELQARVTELEKQLNGLMARVKPPPSVPWWKRIVGKFEEDPIFDEVVKEIRKRRRAEYAALKARRSKEPSRQNSNRRK